MAPLKTESGNISAAEAVCEIKIVLLGTKPPIWRRMLVPAAFTLGQLHDVVQVVMGWEGCHLHKFYVGKRVFGIPDSNEAFMGESLTVNEKKACLANLLNKVGAKTTYIYDFGDSWKHALTVENIVPAERCVAYPLCTGGELAGPPEDCGGISGFYHMLEALADAKHEDHEDMQDWIESFDPEAFSIEAVNQRLRRIFRAPRKPKVAKQKSVIFKPSPEDLQAAIQALDAAFERPHSKPRRRIQS